MQELEPAALFEIGSENSQILGLKISQVVMVVAALLVGMATAVLVRPHAYVAFIVGVFTMMAAYEFFPKYPVISLSCVLILGGFILLLA